MKSILLIGTTIISTVTATLPLKNFPGKGRKLKTYDRFDATSASHGDVTGGGADCHFSTLNDLLPQDTIQTFSADKKSNYAGGFATVIQLSNKQGYAYWMRTSSTIGDVDVASWVAVDSDSSGVMCKEYEDHEMNAKGTSEHDSWCGEQGNGIHQTTTGDFAAHAGLHSDPMKINNVKFTPDTTLTTGLCTRTTTTKLQGVGILGGSTCTPLLQYNGDGSTALTNSPIPGAPFSGNPNGIFTVTRSCTSALSGGALSQSVTTCTDVIGAEIYDIAIASTCSESGTAGQSRQADTADGKYTGRGAKVVEEAFVWFRYTRGKYTITFNQGGTTGGLSLADQSQDGTKGSINHWLGDILFVRPRQVAQQTAITNTMEELPLYVTGADAKVEFSSTDDSGNASPGFAGKCTSSSGQAEIGSEGDNTVGAEFQCKAKITATVSLADAGQTSCSPKAYIKTSLVQFARIHAGHVEEGANATIKSSNHAQGFEELTGGAAMKYACSALNRGVGLVNGEVGCSVNPTDAAASGAGEWNCIDDCKTGNPFHLLEYREKISFVSSPTDDGVQIVGDAKALQNPFLDGDAIPYTYVIGYVDFGFGCWGTETDDQILDHYNSRRLAGSKLTPQTWETRSMMILAGGHPVDVQKKLN